MTAAVKGRCARVGGGIGGYSPWLLFKNDGGSGGGLFNFKAVIQGWLRVVGYRPDIVRQNRTKIPGSYCGDC